MAFPLEFLKLGCIKLNDELASTNNEADDIYEKHIRTISDNRLMIEDFEDDLEWMNVLEPISLRYKCARKLVILNFFTYSCIHCARVLADLKELEKWYSMKKEFCIISVHTPKFENEKDDENFKKAVQRLGITHPVVNDPERTMWNQFRLNVWPAVMVLGRFNIPLYILYGEGHRVELLYFVSVAMRFYGNTLCDSDLPLGQRNPIATRDAAQLSFPGKLSVNPYWKGRPTDPYIAISDTGNHRILLANSTGTILRILCGPTPGFKDGDVSKARLDSPQGLCWMSDTLLVVCDTGNHALRLINLTDYTVSVLAGTGTQAEEGDLGGACFASQDLSSPWDVVHFMTPDIEAPARVKRRTPIKKKEFTQDQLRSVLLIAMPGCHQVWALFMDDIVWWKREKFTKGTCLCILGSGRGGGNTRSSAASAMLCQPSGLAIRSSVDSFSTASELLIADSGSSSIKKVNLQTGQVSTLAGGDGNPANLFAYGDSDGLGTEAKFQYPLGITYSESSKCAYVADTFNHKIKSIDCNTGRVKTCSFTDRLTCAPIILIEPDDCTSDSVNADPIKFNEPSGVCITPDGKYLYVADTNNESVKILNLTTNACEEFKVAIVRYVPPPENLRVYNNEFYINRKNGITCVQFHVDLHTLPKNYKAAPGAAQYWNVVVRDDKLQDSSHLFEFLNDSQKGDSLQGEIRLCLKKRTDMNYFKVDLSFNMTLWNEGRCVNHNFTVRSNLFVRDSVEMIERYKITCQIRTGEYNEV